MAAAPPLPKSFEEATSLRAEVEAELERVCQSPPFHGSKRSRDFLNYVVRVTLSGRIDSLKERSIGIDLLGRDTSYDPSSDATVRVRANEVRKRLASYYGSTVGGGTFRIDLPIGSYVPRFLPVMAAPVPAPVMAETKAVDEGTSSTVPPISTLVLMRPAFFALLLCILLLRQQLDSREDFLRFWDRLLAGRTNMQLSVASEDHDRLEPGLYPLFWIAGRYGITTTVNATPVTGAFQANTALVRISAQSPWQAESRLHWQIRTAEPGRREALLTLLPEAPGTLYLQATDAEALRALCEELITSKEFPEGLLKPASNNRPVQLLVWQNEPGGWNSGTWTSPQ